MAEKKKEEATELEAVVAPAEDKPKAKPKAKAKSKEKTAAGSCCG